MEKLRHSPVTFERAFLGRAVSTEAVPPVAIALGLRPDDFSTEAHAVIYSALLDLADRREPCGLLATIQELEERGRLVAAGGPSYVSGLLDGPGVTDEDDPAGWVDGIRQHAAIRKARPDLMRAIEEAESAHPRDAVANIQRALAPAVTAVFRDGADGQLPLPRLFALTDMGNAERLVARHGRDLKHAPSLGWLTWDGRQWRRDEKGGFVTERAKLTVRAIHDEAQGESNDEKRLEIARYAVRSESVRAIEAMVKLARSASGIAAEDGDFDRDPWLFNVANGTLDLRSGELRSHDRADLLTGLSPVTYIPDADAPRWRMFLERVVPDDEVRAFLQRLAGYWLTGAIRDHVLPMLYGTGRNGKSTFTETIRYVLGDGYSHASGESLLLTTSKNGRHPSETFSLRGKRLAFCAETEDGRALAEVAVKQLTGGDAVSTRALYSSTETTFTPSCKFVMTTNHRPQVRGTDEGVWSRIALVPFTVTIPEDERDPNLRETLQAEAPGILRWALDGCRLWQEAGNRLRPPATVRAATADYRSAEDVVGQFLRERCHVLDPAIAAAERVRAGELLAALKTWADANGTPPPDAKRFAATMEERGFRKLHTKTGAMYLGLRFLTAGEMTDRAETAEAVTG